MKWLAIVLACVATHCLAARCGMACSANADCVGSDPNTTMCCVAGLCEKAKFLYPGDQCTTGRTQDQVCASKANNGGACPFKSVPFILYGYGLTNSDGSRTYPSDELCINNACRIQPELLQEDSNCACQNDTQCESGSICESVCVDDERDPGQPCVANRQCSKNPVCSGGVCQALALDANCSVYNCIGNGCKDACYPNKCLPVYSSSAGKCGVPKAEGQSCTNDCNFGFNCYGGKCTKSAALGQNCSTSISSSGAPRCATGLFCDTFATPKVCQSDYSRANGANCSEHDECASRSCRADQGGQRTCFGGNLLGAACNNTGTDDCSEDYSCDCKTNTCMATDTSTTCYAETLNFAEVFVSAFEGTLPTTSNETLTNIYIDYMCCYACKKNEYIGLLTIDCTARSFTAPAAACTTPKAVISGCAGWTPNPPPKESGTASVGLGAVAILLTVLIA